MVMMSYTSVIMLIDFFFHHMPIVVPLAEVFPQILIFPGHDREIIRGALDHDRSGRGIPGAALKGYRWPAPGASPPIMRRLGRMDEQLRPN